MSIAIRRRLPRVRCERVAGSPSTAELDAVLAEVRFRPPLKGGVGEAGGGLPRGLRTEFVCAARDEHLELISQRL
eukprot:746451-Heterocapsa_arctica.AAC.1